MDTRGGEGGKLLSVLLFGSESWVLLVAMEKIVEGEHTGFLIQIMGKRSRWNIVRTWVTLALVEVREEYWIQLAATYIRRRYGTVDPWVVLFLILKFFAMEKVY